MATNEHECTRINHLFLFVCIRVHSWLKYLQEIAAVLGRSRAIEVEIPRVQQPIGLDFPHRRQQSLCEMRMVLFYLREQAADRLAHRARPLRAAARDHRRSERLSKLLSDMFGDKHQRTDQPKILRSRPRHRREGAATPPKTTR